MIDWPRSPIDILGGAPVNYYGKAFTQYATFSGRAGRMEFWVFTLVNLAVAGVGGTLFIMSALLGYFVFDSPAVAIAIWVVFATFALVTLLPSLAVTVRRLHDTDRSGWFILLGLVPLVGEIILVVLLVMEGTRGPNRFGADPKSDPIAPDSFQPTPAGGYEPAS
jgi:uncharacterized membrane protein YhaH (DUF805 family)